MPIEWMLYPALGVIAGILAGMLGVGGGLVLVAALAWLLPVQGVPSALAIHSALATSLASIVITASASALAHHRRGSVLWPSVAWLLPGLLLGGWLGSDVATLLSGDYLRMFVAGYCAVAALHLMFGKPGKSGTTPGSTRGALLSASGLVIGAISTLVGIGGGSMTVPLLVWRGVPTVRAIGTASACGVGIGLAGAIGYATRTVPAGMPFGSIGFVFVPAAIGIAVTSVPAAPYGVRLAHHLSGKTLKNLFSGFLILVAASILGH